MIRLPLGSYQFQYRDEQDKRMIWDIIRKKYVLLSPEEFVRQHVVHYLVETHGYPASLMRTEVQIDVNGLKKRCDILVYDRDSKPMLLVECKAPSEPVNIKVLEQLLRYNQTLKVKYGMLSNGHETYCAKLKNGELFELTDIPPFPLD